MRNIVCSALACVAILVAGTQHAFTQITEADLKAGERPRRVQRELKEIGLGNPITVSRMDEKDFFGIVKEIGDAEFKILEADNNVVQIFKYEDVKNVRPGIGSRNPFTGKRKNPRNSKVWAGVVAAGILLTIGVLLSKER